MPERFERHGVLFGRPLLGAPGQALRDWLTDGGVPFVDDPTNRDARYTRNRIRATLLPVLEQHFPAFRDTFARSARHAAQAQRLLEELAATDLEVVGQPPRIAVLQTLSRERQANVLRHWLRQANDASPSEAQLDQLMDQIDACRTRGHHIRLKVADGHVLRDGGALRFTTEPSV